MLTRREIVALLLAFLVTLPAVTTRLYASDEVQYYAWLRSVAFDRDADFENEYQHFYETTVRTSGFHETFLEDKWTDAGRRINFAPIGSAVAWAPFYAVGHLIALASGAPADGYSRPYVIAVTYGSALYGVAAVLLAAAIARRVVGRGLGASLLVAAGTPLVFYVYVAPPFAHATSAFGVSLFLWLWLRARENWTVRNALWLGLAGGFMAMVREQDAAFAIGPAIDFVRWAWRSGGVAAVGPARSLAIAITGVVSFLVAWMPQLVAYLSLNGRPGPSSYATRKMTWTSPHALDVLVSPEHGLLAWTPLAVLALAGLVLLALGRVARERRDAAWIGALALVMFALQIYLSGAVDSWTVAGAFGQRRFVATSCLLTLGLAALMSAARTRSARVLLAVAVVLCVWWNLGLMMLFGAHRMDRQELDLAANARGVFVDLPREAPGLVWRYLTDRSSFYGR
jgi:hypothetical protein